MSLAVRFTRALAVALTLALMGAGLVALPATAATSSVLTRAAITKLVAQELKEHNQPAPKSDTYLTAYAQAWARKLNESPASSVGEPSLEIPPSADGWEVSVAVTQCEDKRTFLGKYEFLFAADFCVSNGYFLHNAGFDTTHVGVGYVLNATKFYLVVVYANYSEGVARTLSAAKPSLKGPVRVGATVTAQRGTWKPVSSLNSFNYEWSVAGEPVGNGTSYLIRPQDKGKRLTLTVTGSRPGFWVPGGGTRTVNSKPVAAGVLVSASPVVTGSRNVGSTLTVTSPEWGPGDVALDYQWLRSGKDIAGATETTYPLTAADLGKKIDVRVTGHLEAYATSTRKTATATKTGAPLLTGPTSVTIVGAAKVDETLAAEVANVWVPATTKVGFQWYIAGKPVAAATKSTFVVPGTAAGKSISVRFTGSATGFANTSVMSAGSAAVELATWSGGGFVTVTGTQAKGKTLTAVVTNNFAPRPTSWGYQWYTGDTPIAKATAKTYTVSSTALAGSEIWVHVAAKRQGYRVEYIDSRLPIAE